MRMLIKKVSYNNFIFMILFTFKVFSHILFYIGNFSQYYKESVQIIDHQT